MRKLGWICVILFLLAACASPIEEARSPSVIPATSAPTRISTAAAVAEATATAPTPPTTTALPTLRAPTAITTPTVTPTATAVPATVLTAAWSYPIGLPNRSLGDGFFIRHGYTTENTWYNPGYWHTGEDWYALDGDTVYPNFKVGY